MPYFDAMAAFVPQGRAMARLLYGCPGIQVPGGIGPQVRGSRTLPCVGSHVCLALRSGHGRGRGGGYGAEVADPDGDRTSPDAVSVGHACHLADQNVSAIVVAAQVPFVEYWRYTRDRSWAERVGYPFVAEALEFWECW